MGGEPAGDQSAGERLGQGQGQAPFAQQVEHDGLHGVVVEPEDDVADEGPDPLLLLVEDGGDLGFGRGLGGDPHLESLPSARQERDRRGTGLVEAPDLVVELLGQPGLGLAPGPQRPAVDHRGDAGPGPEVRQDALGHHLLHLPGHPGDRVHDLALVGTGERADESGSRPRHRRVERGSHRYVGLEQVVVGHRAPAAAEHRPDPLDERLVPHELDAHHRGDGVAGDVVLGRPQSAADDDGVAAVEREAQHLDHAIEVVPDLRLVVAVDPHEGELLADPRRVRVDDLPQQELRAHRDHFTLHRFLRG